MHVMRDLTSVVLASEQVSLGSVEDARRMVREADDPELMACYDRISELEGLLYRARFLLSIDHAAVSVDCVNSIDDALDPHMVLSS